MADTKFTVLGMSGAGKTCYLLGLYYKMGSGLKGYTITSDDDTDVELRDRYAKLCDSNLGPARFPAGTDAISKYTFELQYGFNSVLSYDWIDYPGGALERKNEGNLEEYEDIKKTINDSSCLFICVDGSLLIGDDNEEKVEKVKDKCSAVINTFFSEYKKSNNKIPPTAIIVTKYDLCKDDTDEDELCEIIEEAFSSFFVKDDDDLKRIVTIIPVSVGINIMADDIGGKLKPINVHLPIFMGIWFALSDKIEQFSNKIEQLKSLSEQKIDALKYKKVKEENRLIKFKSTKNEIIKLAQEIQSIKDDRMIKDKQMNRILDIMAKNNEKLLKELNCIPYVYINSERVNSFTDILQRKEA